MYWTTCVGGTYQSVQPDSKTNRECESCSYGHYSTGDNNVSCTVWSTCVAGEYIDSSITPNSETNRNCLSCSSDHYSIGDNNTSCTAWTTCVGGTYQTVQPDSKTNRECESCQPGKYNNSKNVLECLICDFGHYTATKDFAGNPNGIVEGATHCIECAIFTFNTPDDNGLVDDTCEFCDAGYYTASQESINNEHGVSKGAIYCNECMAGTYSMRDTETATSANTCQECGYGQYAASAESTENEFGVQSGASYCNNCMNGTYQPVEIKWIEDGYCKNSNHEVLDYSNQDECIGNTWVQTNGYCKNSNNEVQQNLNSRNFCLWITGNTWVDTNGYCKVQTSNYIIVPEINEFDCNPNDSRNNVWVQMESNTNGFCIDSSNILHVHIENRTDCIANKESTCKTCPDGTVSAYTLETKYGEEDVYTGCEQETNLVQCDPGDGYTSVTKSCIECEVGKYSDETSNSACEKCPENEIPTNCYSSTQQGGVRCQNCTSCSTGTYSQPGDGRCCPQDHRLTDAGECEFYPQKV